MYLYSRVEDCVTGSYTESASRKILLFLRGVNNAIEESFNCFYVDDHLRAGNGHRTCAGQRQ